VLVVLSDGGDNASRATREEAVHAAQVSNAVIYTVALADSSSSDANPALLRDLARASGGASFRPRRPRDVTAAFDSSGWASMSRWQPGPGDRTRRPCSASTPR
jgi:Mg-chelatase subunit ChlD